MPWYPGCLWPNVGRGRLFTLDVFLIRAPVTEEFAKRNPAVSRIIQIKGHQTLEGLDDGIFDAFDREEEHLCEFQRGPFAGCGVIGLRRC